MSRVRAMRKGENKMISSKKDFTLNMQSSSQVSPNTKSKEK